MQSMKKSIYTVTSVKALHGWDPGEDGYLATLRRDGQKIGLAGMEANGGCERFEMSDGDLERLIEDAHRALGQKRQDLEKSVYAWDGRGVASEFVEQLVRDYEEQKWLKRNSKTKTLYKLKGQKPEQFGTWPKRPYSMEVHEYLVKKYGDKLVTVYDRQGGVASL